MAAGLAYSDRANLGKGVIEKRMVIKPLSVNKAWQGRRFKTPLYQAFEREMLFTLGRAKKPLTGAILLEITVFLKHPAMSDLGNYEKTATDCLVKAGYIKDDRYIEELVLKKEKSDEEGFLFRIQNKTPE